MSDEQRFEDYYAQAVFTEDKATARAAYEAGRESLLGALLEMVEEDKERVASAFYSDATQEVIDSFIANNTAVAAAGR